MPKWYDSTVLADSQSLTAGNAVTGDISQYHTPAICVALEDLEGNADDTITVEVVGAAGTYEVDERTLSAVGSYIVEAPQADTVKVTSSNGVTYSIEARNNPR
ncbi:hypothetical protein [Haloarcula pellucida]|uniref:Uncharacterized protein n=1 Tax=Haloarcula pellucida TaxID=1427151 RepID=A0A830GRZ7_9EURY|nr:hypothetical protein [Halomicroarcula pellucida]MBX0350380.1 hypothetical protein [Halomicroarcula pellucida]GGO01797.1 hypothetical protein GCM10009030_35840 [Halomicroarcula pellucida]